MTDEPKRERFGALVGTVRMSPDDVRQGLAVDPFDVQVSQAQDEWVVVWLYEGLEIGRATFKEIDEGLEWTRLNIRPEFHGRGIYTQILRFCTKQRSARVAGDTGERDFYLRSGWKDQDDWLVLDKKAAKAWLKGR